MILLWKWLMLLQCVNTGYGIFMQFWIFGTFLFSKPYTWSIISQSTYSLYLRFLLFLKCFNRNVITFNVGMSLMKILFLKQNKSQNGDKLGLSVPTHFHNSTTVFICRNCSGQEKLCLFCGWNHYPEDRSGRITDHLHWLHVHSATQLWLPYGHHQGVFLLHTNHSFGQVKYCHAEILVSTSKV